MSQSENIAQANEAESLRDKTLKLAGLVYLVGDAGVYAAGKMEGNPYNKMTGAIFAAGGVAASVFGNPSAERQLELMSQKLGGYLRKQGIVIPDTPTTAKLAKQGGVIDHIFDFFHTYPSEMLNAAYAIGAGFMMKGAFDRGNKPDQISGALIAAGALAGLLIPEKKLEDGKKPETWGEWVQEKPLRVSGALYTANNAVMLWASRDKYVANTGYSYIPRAITAVSYIFANAMLYLSNRGQTNDNKNDLSAKLADAAAQVIAAQPKEAQQALVHEIAGFMAAQPDIKRKAGDIVTLLTTKLAEIGADKTWQTAVAQAPAPIAR